jgi:hypothetical protein
MIKQKASDALGKRAYLIQRAETIGHVGLIAQIDDVLVRKLARDLAPHTHSPHPRVKDADKARRQTTMRHVVSLIIRGLFRLPAPPAAQNEIEPEQDDHPLQRPEQTKRRL